LGQRSFSRFDSATLTRRVGCGNIDGVSDSIQVRPARPEDERAVTAFCQNTFEWGDYVPRVWGRWLADPQGKLFVATVGDEPVGVLHVALLEGGAAWMEGMRVNPAFWRRGVGSALDLAGRGFARHAGCRVVRLATSATNAAAQKTLFALGYARTAQFNEWQAEPLPGTSESMRIAAEADVHSLLAEWSGSAIEAAGAGLIPNQNWRWTELDQARLSQHLHAGEVRVTAGGFSICSAASEVDWSSISVSLLCGDMATAERLARAARNEAAYRGYPQVDAMIAEYGPLNSALKRAGFAREGEMLIYQQAL
jgi:GNAT superfamily N-acetyltransferase